LAWYQGTGFCLVTLVAMREPGHSRLLRWWYLLVFVLPPHPHRNVQSGRTKGLTMILTYALVISVGHWEANGACFICQLQGVTCIQQVRISAAP
jgi:hypothetical protein